MSVKETVKAEIMSIREIEEVVPLILACYLPGNQLSRTCTGLEVKALDKRPGDELWRLQCDVVVSDKGCSFGEVSTATPEMRMLVMLYGRTGNVHMTGTACGFMREWDEANVMSIREALTDTLKHGGLKGDGMRVEIVPLDPDDDVWDENTHMITI